MTPTAPPRPGPGPALVLGAYALGPGAVVVFLVFSLLMGMIIPGGQQTSRADVDIMLALVWVPALAAYMIAGPAALAAGIGHLMARSQGRWRLALPVTAAGLVQALAVLLTLAMITGGDLSQASRRFEEYVVLWYLPPLAMGMAALIGAALLAFERRARAIDAGETRHG